MITQNPVLVNPENVNKLLPTTNLVILGSQELQDIGLTVRHQNNAVTIILHYNAPPGVTCCRLYCRTAVGLYSYYWNGRQTTDIQSNRQYHVTVVNYRPTAAAQIVLRRYDCLYC